MPQRQKVADPMLATSAAALNSRPEYGKGWRRELKPWLEQTLGHRVYDPAEDEKKPDRRRGRPLPRLENRRPGALPRRGAQDY
jgi:hypothetical protein